MTKRVCTYGNEVYELAKAFLSDCPDKNTEDNIHILATTIQRSIEDEIEFGLKPKEGADSQEGSGS